MSTAAGARAGGVRSRHDFALAILNRLAGDWGEDSGDALIVDSKRPDLQGLLVRQNLMQKASSSPSPPPSINSLVRRTMFRHVAAGTRNILGAATAPYVAYAPSISGESEHASTLRHPFWGRRVRCATGEALRDSEETKTRIQMGIRRESTEFQCAKATVPQCCFRSTSCPTQNSALRSNKKRIDPGHRCSM
ncbi:hypothetical protein IG631_21717 [Alternaria alternata]|nr:hypothetical protein IG631_21717 [Alternaria alternata]